MASLIDTNVYLSRWPFRRLRFDEPALLVEKLRKEGVTQAWAGTFDGLLHKDIASANHRLVADCEKYGRRVLVPFGSINLRLDNWEEDLRRCHEQYKMPGVRIHPNYHGYKLTDPVFTRFLEMAAERGLLVQLVALMEDRRTQHPLMQLSAVDMTGLAGIIKPIANLRLQLLNAMQALRGQVLLSTMAAGDVYFDIATLEGVGGVGNLIAQIPLSRVCFGSYSPFFIFESAKLKLKESPLSEEQLRAISRDNAQKLLGRK